MKDWRKIVIDSPEMWPKSTHVDLEEPFVDDRGSLQLLVNTPMKRKNPYNLFGRSYHST